MGASGFVGSHVTRKLVERGDDVRVYLRKSSKTMGIDGLDVERLRESSLYPFVEFTFNAVSAISVHH